MVNILENKMLFSFFFFNLNRYFFKVFFFF